MLLGMADQVISRGTLAGACALGQSWLGLEIGSIVARLNSQTANVRDTLQQRRQARDVDEI